MLDAFLSRPYDPKHYNCAHLAIEVWECLMQRPVASSIYGFLVPGETRSTLHHAEGVRMLAKPEDGCFVLMRSKVRPPHVGIYYRGKIIQFAGNKRVQNLPPEVALTGYTRVRYFTC